MTAGTVVFYVKNAWNANLLHSWDTLYPIEANFKMLNQILLLLIR